MSSVLRTYDTYLDFHILNTFPSSASGSSIYAQAIFMYMSALSPKTPSKSEYNIFLTLPMPKGRGFLVR